MGRLQSDLLTGLANAYILGDSAYSSRALVEQLKEQGCTAVIPSNPTHAARAMDKHIYKERCLVENFFQRIKRWRRIAMRFEKLARNYLGFLHLAAALVWLC
jgi:transposase